MNVRRFLEVIVMKLRTHIFIIVLLAMAMSAPLWALHTDGGCAGCHAAHNSDDPCTPFDAVQVPLWKGVLAPSAGFTPYDSPTLDAADVGQPDGDSLMCLSCHDGTTQSTSVTNIAGNDNLGRDLTDDHPISFQYTATLPANEIGTGLYNPTSQPSGLGGTIDEDMLDAGNKMQCTSCHDVHEQHNLMALRIDNTSGGLCKACHMK